MHLRQEILKSVLLLAFMSLIFVYMGFKQAFAENSRLSIFAAASLIDLLPKALESYKKHQDNGVEVTFNFQGSQNLAFQIGQGASPDIFFSADERWMTYVSKKGWVFEPKAFLANSLVFVLSPNIAGHVKSLMDLQKNDLSFAIAHSSVPVGGYTKKVLDNLSGLYGKKFTKAVRDQVVTYEDSVRNVILKVTYGSVDAGIVYKTDYLSVKDKGVLAIEIPKQANIKAYYYVAILKRSDSLNEAKSFINFLSSKEANGIFKEFGFESI